MISLRGSTLRFQPPLVIKEADLQRAFTIMHQVFEDFVNGKLKEPNGRHHIGW
jgi:4-aminobutyrate aminotransferase